MAHDRKVAVYIDGFNLYHAIDGLNRPQLKWLNLATLAQSFVRQNEVLAKCHYFTSISMWNPDKAERHTAYIAALEAYGVQCSLGVFKQSKRFCREQKRTCSFTEEKRTDVALAVNVVADAMKHVFDRLVLITADTDQIPTIEMVKSVRPDSIISWAAPPGRAKMAREIGKVASERLEISPGRLATCLLPKVVLDPNGVPIALRPHQYS